MTRLTDAHNHLQDAWLLPHRAAVLRDLETIGIARSVVNGTCEADWEEVESLACGHSWVLPSYGLHPWFLKTRTPQWKERLSALVAKGHCGIGEIGLDRWIKDYDLDDQKEVFAWQLALAAERNLPATLHCLQAWGALWEIIESHPVPACGFLLHSYGGALEMVGGFLECGAYFSFSGHFLHERKADRREVFQQIPADRLLVETDAPSMPPPPEWNRYPLPNTPDGHPVNHPANVMAIYEGLAQLRGWTFEETATRISENFQRLFGG